MAVISYKAPSLLFHAHLQTIYPALFRKVKIEAYKRERIITPDHDFLDLDWLSQGHKELIILSHGLEGNSYRPYVKGMAKAFHQNGFDVLAWNYRGCSGEMNKTLRFYHSGATDDLLFVIQHAIKKGYESIFLVGFSLGGNLTLKYVGEMGDQLPWQIKKAVAFSVPLHLHSSCLQISRPSNFIYANRFLKSLKNKILVKAPSQPKLSVKGLSEIKTLIAFDNEYTAPLHGYKDALDYYEQCSSLYFLNKITIPTLIVNAKNDPFLSDHCYPTADKLAPSVCFETPHEGGHVGFSRFDGNGLYWSELRALDFILH